MKRCPECRRDYSDDTLLFCLEDGAALVQGSVTDEPATAILSGDRRSGENLTAMLHAAGTTARSGPVTLRLPSFLSWERLPWMLVGALALCLVGTFAFSIRNSFQAGTNEPVKAILHMQPPGRNSGAGQLSISPDGRTVAVLVTSEGVNRLWLRGLDSLEGRLLPGTEGAGGFPFWSPDGRSIGFVSRNKLKRIDVAGGTVQELTDVTADVRGFGGTWNRDGTILFNQGGGIGRTTATGGDSGIMAGYEPRPDGVDRWPTFLPDGKHFLFLTTSSAAEARSEVVVGSLDSPERKLLFSAESNAFFLPSPDGRGHLLFARGGILLAQGFNTESLELVGEPFRVAERVRVNFNSRAFLGVSENGTIVLDENTESEDQRQLTWFDRAGKQLETVGQAGPIFRFKLSPDEKFAAITRRSMDSARADVFVSDITRGASSRLGSAPGNDTPEIIWSPDGKYVIWNEIAEGKFRLVRKLASGAGEAEVLVESPIRVFPLDSSPDGKYILYAATDNVTKNDLWLLPLDGERKPAPFFRTPHDERWAVFSPDGKYVAYSSEESGRNEVYVQTFPTSTEKWTISTNGGQGPRWPRKGTELFYTTTDGMVMSAAIRPGTTFEAGVPQTLFDVALARSARTVDYSVSNDGQRFLFISREAAAATAPLVVILNWSAGPNR